MSSTSPNKSAASFVKLAGCVIVDDMGKLLLLHRNTDKYKHWEIPGGKIEAGEIAEQAAKR